MAESLSRDRGTHLLLVQRPANLPDKTYGAPVGYAYFDIFNTGSRSVTNMAMYSSHLLSTATNHENPQVQHCQDDLPNHRRKSPSVQTLFLVLVCSFRSRRLHQPQDLSVRPNNQILTTKLLMYNLRKPVGAADSDDDDENQTSVGC